MELSLTYAHYQDSDNVMTLRWEIDENLTSFAWLKALLNLMQNNSIPFSRHTGFVSGPKDMKWLANVLNGCIAKINDDGRYHISERAEAFFNQDFANAIHHHFEILRGEVILETDYYKNSDKLLTHSVCGLNHCIHDMEALHRSLQIVKKNYDNYTGVISFEFFNPTRYKLPDDAYQRFSLDMNFGDLYLHYAQIGKTWLEAFVDQDEHIFSEAIRPLDTLTGEFNAFFGEVTFDQQFKNQLFDFIKMRGGDPDDIKNALGICRIGKFIDDYGISKKDLKKLIGEHQILRKIEVTQNGRVIQSMKIDPLIESYLYLRFASR
ncbi:MAG: hypothetical protein Fur0010_11450 [Bdellovibrio sp.]